MIDRGRQIRLGTRGSKLALAQTETVRRLLAGAGITDTRVIVVETTGDREKSLPLAEIPSQGVFTREIERALLHEEIDLAVHSYKDLETTQPDGLHVAAVPERNVSHETLLIRPNALDLSAVCHLKQGAVVGTSSLRREAQLRFHRPDLTIKDLRGNLPTRLKKLRAGKYDAIMLAAAGIDRLGLNLDDIYRYDLPETLLLPAPAQGALAVECRSEDREINEVLKTVNAPDIQRLVEAERSLLRQIGGGCSVPLGVHIEPVGDKFRVCAFLGHQDGDSWEASRRMILVVTDLQPAIPGIARSLTRKFNRKFLAGKRVAITREKSSVPELQQRVEQRGGTLIPIPVMQVAPAGDPDSQQELISRLAEFSWILFTSSNGVKAFRALVNRFKADVPDTIKFGVIGSGTAHSLEREFGRQPDFIPAISTGQTMAEEFRGAYPPDTNRILMPVAQERHENAERLLRDAGYHVETLVVYRTIPRPLSPNSVIPEDLDSIVFTSPKNVRYFLEQADVPPGCRVVAIGPSTAAYAAERGIVPVFQSYAPDSAGIMEVLHVIDTKTSQT